MGPQGTPSGSAPTDSAISRLACGHSRGPQAQTPKMGRLTSATSSNQAPSGRKFPVVAGRLPARASARRPIFEVRAPEGPFPSMRRHAPPRRTLERLPSGVGPAGPYARDRSRASEKPRFAVCTLRPVAYNEFKTEVNLTGLKPGDALHRRDQPRRQRSSENDWPRKGPRPHVAGPFRVVEAKPFSQLGHRTLGGGRDVAHMHVKAKDMHVSDFARSSWFASASSAHRTGRGPSRTSRS